MEARRRQRRQVAQVLVHSRNLPVLDQAMRGDCTSMELSEQAERTREMLDVVLKGVGIAQHTLQHVDNGAGIGHLCTWGRRSRPSKRKSAELAADVT